MNDQPMPPSVTPPLVTSETLTTTDDMGRINIIKPSAVKRYSGVESKAPWLGYDSREVGWVDGNRLLKPTDVFGTDTQTALYQAMRNNLQTIKTYMDYRKMTMASLSYCLRPANESEEAQLVALLVERYIENQPASPTKGINNLMADIYDKVSTFGHVFYEIQLTKDGNYKLNYIPPHTIEYINLTEDGRYIESITQNTSINYTTIDADKLTWYAQSVAFEGNYWGISDLRPLIQPYTTAEKMWQNYLSQVRFSKSFIIANEKSGEDSTTSDGYINLLDWMTAVANDKEFPLILDRALEVNVLKSDTPVTSYIVEVIKMLNEDIREGLAGSLNSLGISGTGARALGDSFSVSDAEKLSAHIENFIAVVNGQFSPHSRFLQVITESMGYDKSLTPRIEAENNIEVKVENRIEKVIMLIEKGIISPEELGLKNKMKLLEELGLGTNEFREIHKDVLGVSEE